MAVLPTISSKTTELHTGNAYWMARLAKEIYRSVPDSDGRPDDAAILASLKQDDPGFLSVDGF